MSGNGWKIASNSKKKDTDTTTSTCVATPACVKWLSTLVTDIPTHIEGLQLLSEALARNVQLLSELTAKDTKIKELTTTHETAMRTKDEQLRENAVAFKLLRGQLRKDILSEHSRETDLKERIAETAAAGKKRANELEKELVHARAASAHELAEVRRRAEAVAAKLKIAEKKVEDMRRNWDGAETVLRGKEKELARLEGRMREKEKELGLVEVDIDGFRKEMEGVEKRVGRIVKEFMYDRGLPNDPTGEYTYPTLRSALTASKFILSPDDSSQASEFPVHLSNTTTGRSSLTARAANIIGYTLEQHIFRSLPLPFDFEQREITTYLATISENLSPHKAALWRSLSFAALEGYKDEKRVFVDRIVSGVLFMLRPLFSEDRETYDKLQTQLRGLFFDALDVWRKSWHHPRPISTFWPENIEDIEEATDEVWELGKALTEDIETQGSLFESFSVLPLFPVVWEEGRDEPVCEGRGLGINAPFAVSARFEDRQMKRRQVEKAKRGTTGSMRDRRPSVSSSGSVMSTPRSPTQGKSPLVQATGTGGASLSSHSRTGSGFRGAGAGVNIAVGDK